MECKVVYFEVPATDMQRAKKFYSSAFNWGTKDWDPTYSTILCAETDQYMHSVEQGAITGGIQLKSDRAVAPTVVIQTDDIDQVISKIEENGGTIVLRKERMQDLGWYAQFNDSEGNRVGLFQPGK